MAKVKFDCQIEYKKVREKGGKVRDFDQTKLLGTLWFIIHDFPTLQMVKDIAKQLFLEVIEEKAREISRTMLAMLQMFIKSSTDIINDMAGEVIQKEARYAPLPMYQGSQRSENPGKVREFQNRNFRPWLKCPGIP